MPALESKAKSQIHSALLPLLLVLVALGCGCQSVDTSNHDSIEVKTLSLAKPMVLSKPVNWPLIANRTQGSVVAIVANGPVLDGPAGYGGKLWTAVLTFGNSPLSGLLQFAWQLIFGWLDLTVAEGTGFFVDDDHILTNAHVIEGAEEIFAIVQNKPVRMTVVRIDLGHDLALLVPESGQRLPEGIRPLEFRDSVFLGEQTAILGFASRPFPEDDRPISLTTGVVSTVKVDLGKSLSRFQTDAAANPGASGSPCLDCQGRVLGIVTNQSRPAVRENQAFVIPSTEIFRSGFLRPQNPKSKTTETMGKESKGE